MSGRPVPTALRRRGIRGVTDNVEVHHGLRLPAGAFLTWFTDPLRAHLCGQAQPPSPAAQARKQTQGEDHGN